MRYTRLVPVLILAFLAGCASESESGSAPGPRSQVEKRYFQTRAYETDDPKIVLKAMINVLQDLGFAIKTADAELGILTAERWTDLEYSKKELKKAKKDEITLAETSVLECTANVTKQGKECRVRLTFQERRMGPGGTVMSAEIVENASFYQEFFAKVDKSVFLQKEGV